MGEEVYVQGLVLKVKHERALQQRFPMSVPGRDPGQRRFLGHTKAVLLSYSIIKTEYTLQHMHKHKARLYLPSLQKHSCVISCKAVP